MHIHNINFMVFCDGHKAMMRYILIIFKRFCVVLIILLITSKGSASETEQFLSDCTEVIRIGRNYREIHHAITRTSLLCFITGPVKENTNLQGDVLNESGYVTCSALGSDIHLVTPRISLDNRIIAVRYGMTTLRSPPVRFQHATTTAWLVGTISKIDHLHHWSSTFALYLPLSSPLYRIPIAVSGTMAALADDLVYLAGSKRSFHAIQTPIGRYMMVNQEMNELWNSHNNTFLHMSSASRSTLLQHCTALTHRLNQRHIVAAFIATTMDRALEKNGEGWSELSPWLQQQPDHAILDGISVYATLHGGNCPPELQVAARLLGEKNSTLAQRWNAILDVLARQRQPPIVIETE